MGRAVTNAVLYALEAGSPPRPVASVTIADKDGKAEKNGVQKISHASSEEFRRCSQRGVPAPELVCTLETRSADESGKLNAEYVEADPATLKPLTGAKKYGELGELLSERK